MLARHHRGHAEGDQAPHAAREGVGHLAGPLLHLELRQQLAGPGAHLLGAASAHPAHQLDGLPGGEAADGHLSLGLERTGLPRVVGIGDGVDAVDGDAARVGLSQTDDLADQGGLARAVGTEQAEDLPAAQREGDVVVDQRVLGIRLAEVAHLEGGRGGGASGGDWASGAGRRRRAELRRDAHRGPFTCSGDGARNKMRQRNGEWAGAGGQWPEGGTWR